VAPLQGATVAAERGWGETIRGWRGAVPAQAGERPPVGTATEDNDGLTPQRPNAAQIQGAVDADAAQA